MLSELVTFGVSSLALEPQDQTLEYDIKAMSNQKKKKKNEERRSNKAKTADRD